MLWLRGGWYALRVLFNPKDIRSLLKLGDLLEHTRAYGIYLQRFKADPDARALLEERYSPGLPKLTELESYPPESLASFYRQHMVRNGLSQYPFPIPRNCTEAAYVRERQREIHDILHAVFGLGIEVHEEASLNAILMACVAPPISIVIAAGSFFPTLFKNPDKIPLLIQSVISGWAIGARIKNPFGIKWETKLHLPLAEIKRELGA